MPKPKRVNKSPWFKCKGYLFPRKLKKTCSLCGKDSADEKGYCAECNYENEK